MLFEHQHHFEGSRSSGRYMCSSNFVFQAQWQPANMNNELNEHGASGYSSQLHTHDQGAEIFADMGVSKWQLKGKRNIRNLTKRPVELMDGIKCNGSMHESSYDAKGNSLKKLRMGSSCQRPLHQGFHHRSGRELNYAYKQGDFTEKDLAQTDTGYPLLPKSSSKDRRTEDGIMGSDDDSQGMSPSETDWNCNLPLSPNSEDCLLSQSSLKGYWEDSDQGFDPLRFYPSVYREADPGNFMESMLIDVNLKVQASYQGERVPLVSLMSRLNGKAIIGHPVQIEVLDDGFTDHLLPESNCPEGHTDRNGTPGLPPAWFTARRTSMQRVSRPRQSSAVEDEDWDPNQHPVGNSRRLLKTTHASRFKHKTGLVRKSSRILRPLMNKLSRKIVKKASLPNQKTRTLSSFAVEQKFGGKNGNSEGLVKPEKIIPITCIPVKLVFSRILEAVSGSPPKSS